jgi:leader peptidase (prepilin peptidase) / N-methyltransferase
VETAFRAFVAALFGFAFGSFLTVVVDRVPNKESIVRPRSRCPGCATPIAPRDNIPVLSYLLLRGKCRTCGMRIPVRYPLLELATATAFAGTAAVWNSPYLIVLLCAFCAVMLAVAAIDLERRIIPNRITYPSFVAFAALIALGWALGQELNPAGAAIGALAYGGFFLVIALISPGGMGMGDVKLTGLIGLVLGALGLRYVAVAAGIAILLGGIAGLGALAAGRGRKGAIPFGPSLAAGAIAAVLVGERLASWYLGSVT